jgi:ABC-type Fe3+-hydroxamate transport system substrate-binding protein
MSARVDWAGVDHPPAGVAPRIASVVPSLTELLFALGLSDHVVARTGFCVHPRDAVKAVPKIGGTKDFDLAKLREHAPTHLVVNVDENRREMVDAAREFVPHVIVTHPCAPEDNRRLYELFGAIFDRADGASKLDREFVAALHDLDRAVSALPRERVVYVIWKKPWMAVTRDTYIGSTLARAGWDTLPEVASARYPALDDDDSAWRSAERILLSSEPYAFRPRDVDACAARYARPCHLIDGEMSSWYGPRAIPGMRYLAGLRHRLT